MGGKRGTQFVTLIPSLDNPGELFIIFNCCFQLGSFACGKKFLHCVAHKQAVLTLPPCGGRERAEKRKSTLQLVIFACTVHGAGFWRSLRWPPVEPDTLPALPGPPAVNLALPWQPQHAL